MSKSYTKNGQYTNDSVRIDNKVVIVTGSNCGIGKETAIELARRGGKVYIACRNESRGLEALEEIKELSGSENVHFMQLDLASMESIRNFSRKFHEVETRLDILVNNAGLLSPLERTKDGFEMNMGVNHLGHFLLTDLLLDLLKAATPSRIVVVASTLHSIGTIEKDNLNSEKSFPGVWKGYANSKLANILFVKSLSQRLEGTGVTVNCLCPGAVKTEATRYLNSFTKVLMSPFIKFLYKSPYDGAQTQIMCALEPELQNVTGKYFVGCKIKEPSGKACDDEVADWLWKQSAMLTSLKTE